MRPSLVVPLVALTLGMSLSGCISVSASRNEPEAKYGRQEGSEVVDLLFFGRNIPTGGRVSDTEWANFVAEVVTPRYPAGFTIFQAQGQWRGNDGQIGHEPTMIIEIAHPLDPTDERSIDEIANTYKQRYTQEAVLRIREAGNVKFY